MFCTHSDVSQLKPDTLARGVQGAEEAQYAQGDVFGTASGSNAGSASSISSAGPGGGALTPAEGADLGSVLLGCGSCVQDIHAYFNRLESRTCRVNLGVRRTKNSMRPVPKSTHTDDGSAKTSRHQVDVLYLDSRDLQVFKHAYMCAVFPVLAAPGPPSPVSPSPGPRRSSYHANPNLGSISENHLPKKDVPRPDIHVRSISPLSPEPSTTAKHGHGRTSSPYAFHDSGVEESDEAGLIGLIPMESICQLLQRAFGLSGPLFRQYEAVIIRAYSKTKKSLQKVLAEELTGQLAVLETNNHPFYAPGHFITRNGYDLWQKQERIHIGELLAKFWQNSLPHPRDHQDRIADLQGVHEDYQILLKKLLDYENQFRDETDGTSALTFSPLSSASCRLLLEFGLRYGIGEMFRKTFLLQNLISEFSPTVGYLTYVNNLVLSIKCLLPSNKAGVVMVKQELDVLHSSLRVLKTQTCKALSQMKDLFLDSRPSNGIGLLLGLLKSVMALMAYLAPSNTQHESYKSCVHDTVMGIFRPHYGKIKAAVWADCGQGRCDQISPQMLNIIIVDIVSEVYDFRNNFEGPFQKFFSITKMAAISFYHFLMEDVNAFCQTSSSSQIAIDRQTLALAYRLNQLDSEWGSFILPMQQTWRASFLPKLDEWTKALKLISQQFIVKAVSTDKYLSQKIELPQPLLTYQDPSLASERNSCSISVVSITPSVNSAFSSIMSSIRSTPCHAAQAPMQNGSANLESKTSMFIKKIPILKGSKPKDIQIDKATGLLLEEREPFTLSSSSLDRKLLKAPKFSGNFSSQLPSSDFASLPDNLNKGNASGKTKGTGLDISAWREEVARHQPQIIRSQSQAGFPEKPYEHQSSSEVGASYSCIAQRAVLNNISNISARTKTAGSFTPISSDGEDAKGGESPADQGAFSFPPLRIESQPTNTVDFSQPVFQRPQSCNISPDRQASPCKRGTSSSATGVGAPATVLDRQNLTSFDMIASSSTITMTDTREAILSTSGSLVDVIVLLQRLCGFSSNLLGIILSRDQIQFKTPKSCFSRLKSKESVIDSGEKESKTQKTSDGADAAAADKQSLTASSGSETHFSFPGLKSWSTFSTSFSTTQPHPKTNSLQAVEDIDSKTDRNGSEGFGIADIKRDSRPAFVRTPSRIGPGPAHGKPNKEEEEEEEGQDQEPPPKLFNKLKTRLRLHLQNLGILCNILTVYSTNILCMDLCGTPKAVAKKLIGSNLVNFVRKQQEDGVVWGCRHQGEVPYSCLYYFNRRVDYLCERYEPVTQHMCTRVNNAFACLYLLDEYCDRLAHVFGLEDDGQGIEEAEEEEEEEEEEDQQWEKEKTGTGAAETDIQGREEQLQASERSEGGASGVTSSGDNSLFDVISTSSGYLTSEATAGLEQRDTPQGRYPSGSKYEEPYVNSEDDSLSETMCSVPSVSLKQRWRTQVQQTCSAARHHLLATVTSMCRLQAYKLNLFVRDGLPMLLRLKDPAVTMDSCLSPIITFMHRYLDSLSGWLYRDCFRRVLDYLWVLIVQDIEYHANRLLSAESSASGQAHDWMLAIGVLIRFMNNSGRGIKKELLLSQANNVIFRFQLFTLSTNRLITLHQKLKEYHTEVDELTLEENATRIPPAIIHRIHGDLQSLRKCFSGGELVRWIVKNRSVLPADLSVADEEITKDIAIEIAQDLLDSNFIMELESAFQTKSTTPTSPLDQFSPYPELLVHSHLPSEAEDSSWEEAEGRQHHHSQYYHPKEDVRSGSRSGNSMEAAAVFKEQQAEVHHTFPPLSARSSPGSITPTGSMGNPSAGKGEKSSRKETGTPPSFRGPEGLSSLGLGSRYNPSPLRPTPVYSNRDQLNPGPIHHDTASGKRSADLREPLNQRYRTFVEISHEEEDRVSSDRTPTPSRQRFGEGSSVSQRAQARPECTDQKGLSTPEVASARPGSVNQYHLRETEFLGSLSSRASVADFRSSAVKPQSKSQAGGYGRLRKDSDALSVDSAGLFGRLDFDNVVSPFSSIAELAYTANKQFVASSKHFYFIHQSVLNPSLSFFRHRQQRGEHGSRGTAHHRHGRRAQQSRHQEHHRQKDQHSLYQQMENHSQLFESRRVRSEPSRHLSAPTGSAGTFGPDAMLHLGANFGTQQQDQREGRKDEDAEVTWHQKNAMENLALVEQCISHKISTEYIAAIITGRKKTDKLAKEFFRLSFTG